MTSSSFRSMVPLAALMAAAQVSAQEFTYEEVSTLNLNLEPALYHYSRGDGFLYGASRGQIAGNGGMIYRLAPGQPVEVLHTFETATDSRMINDGGAGMARILAVCPDGAFYGTTQTGGSDGAGVLFRYGVDGTFSILDSARRGGLPMPTDLVVTANGDIYGVSEKDRGNTDGSNNFGGSLFRRAADGTITILHTFIDPPFFPNLPGTTPPTGGSALIEPHHPYRLCEGPNGTLYGITFAGGAGKGVVFRFDLGTNTFEVIADLNPYNDWVREMAPTAGGFHVLTENHLLHVAYDGTVTVEIDGAALPTKPWTFKSAIVETADGTFIHATAGGANNAGCLVRYRPGEGASVVHSYPFTGAFRLDRLIAVGGDGKLHGVTVYPDDYVPPVGATTTGAAASLTAESPETARAAGAAKKKKSGALNPKLFRFRQAGDPVNFPPFARPDTAWLPAKVGKTGAREVLVDILANDGDLDPQPLTVTSVTTDGPASATLVATKKGPRLKIATTEANPTNQVITYQLSDGNGGTAASSVAVYAPLAATFSGPLVPAFAGSPAATLTAKVSGQNAVTATFTVAGKKFTGQGTIDIDDTLDLQLRLRGQSPLPLRADLIRSGASTKLEVYVRYGGTIYSGTLSKP